MVDSGGVGNGNTVCSVNRAVLGCLDFKHRSHKEPMMMPSFACGKLYSYCPQLFSQHVSPLLA